MSFSQEHRNRSVGWRFWLLWVLANAVSFPVGAWIPVLLFQTIGGLACIGSYRCTDAELIGTLLTMFVGFAMGSLAIGLAQWLMLTKQILGISKWWILTSVIGFSVGEIASSMGADLDSNAGAVVVTAMGGLLGGLLTGVAQYLLLKKWVSLTSWWKVWSLLTGFSWSMGWATGVVIHRILSNFIVMYGLDIFIISGGVSGMITGWGLVQLLQHKKVM